MDDECGGSCSNPFLQIWSGGIKPVHDTIDDGRVFAKVAAALEGMRYTTYWGDKVTMRKSDHQLQMPIRMFVHTDKNIEFDTDHSGFGLLAETTVSAKKASTPTTCKMQRP